MSNYCYPLIRLCVRNVVVAHGVVVEGDFFAIFFANFLNEPLFFGLPSRGRILASSAPFDSVGDVDRKQAKRRRPTSQNFFSISQHCNYDAGAKLPLAGLEIR